MRRANPVHQFGQSNDATTFAGRTACTHVALQVLIEFWTGRRATIDEISRIAFYPKPAANPEMRGLRPVEVVRVLQHFKMPYRLALGLSVEELLRASNKGPCLFGMRYGDYPRNDALPPWRARPPYAEVNGATQRAGFDGAHAGVLGGYEFDATDARYEAYTVEPNHASGRPENPKNPPFDLITTSQLRQAFEAIKTTAWNATYAFVPTREWNGPS